MQRFDKTRQNEHTKNDIACTVIPGPDMISCKQSSPDWAATSTEQQGKIGVRKRRGSAVDAWKERLVLSRRLPGSVLRD